MKLFSFLCVVLFASVALGQGIPGYPAAQPENIGVPPPPGRGMYPQIGATPYPMVDPITAASNVLATNPDGIEIRDAHVDTKTIRRLPEPIYNQGYMGYNQEQGYQGQGYQGQGYSYQGQGYQGQGYNQGNPVGGNPGYNQYHTGGNNQPFFNNGFWWFREGYRLWFLNRCNGNWQIYQ